MDIKAAIIINCFWFSLPVIGYAIIKFISSCRHTGTVTKTFSDIALRQHPFVQFIISFSVAVLVFAVISIPLYLFNVQVIVPVIIYVILVILSLGYLIYKSLFVLFRVSSEDVLQVKGQTLIVKMLFIVLCVVIVLDLFLTVFIVKACPWGDAIYHMSRVVSILNDGFNSTSSFHSNLPEGAYIYNVMYTLYAVPAKLFSLIPMKVNEYSLGFFRLLQWFSIFTLATVVFRDWLKVKRNTMLFSTIATLAAISLFSGILFVANYPNAIINIWLILFMIIISQPIRGGKTGIGIGIILTSLALIITMTHPTYSMATACFLVLLTIVRLIFQRRHAIFNLTSSIFYIITLMTLMIGPLMVKCLPVRLQPDLVNIAQPPMISIFGHNVIQPIFPSDPFTWIMWIVAVIAPIIVMVMMYKKGKVFESATLLSATTFFALTANDPVAMWLFRRLMIPGWVIERFSSIDVFRFINFSLIIYCIYYLVLWFIKKIKGPKILSIMTKLLVVVVIFVSLIFFAGNVWKSYSSLAKDWRQKNEAYLEIDKDFMAYKDILNDNKLVISTDSSSYYLMSLFDIDVMAVEWGHWPLASDGGNRGICLSYILGSLNYEDLSATGADYIVSSSIGSEMKGVFQIASTKPYLKLILDDGHFWIFKFIKDNRPGNSSASVYQPCLKYQQNEQK